MSPVFLFQKKSAILIPKHKYSYRREIDNMGNNHRLSAKAEEVYSLRKMLEKKTKEEVRPEHLSLEKIILMERNPEVRRRYMVKSSKANGYTGIWH